MPFVEQRGFRLDEREAPAFWIFRRPTADTVQVFSIQWDKYGRPRFRVDFGLCPIEGMDVAGERIGWADVHPHWLPDVASLRTRGGLLARVWFCQDPVPIRRIFGVDPLRSASEVVDELLAAYPAVDEYWRTGNSGRLVRRWGKP